MSGIAGIIDLAGARPVPEGVLRRMADAMAHRGPDGEAIMETPGAGLVWRQLRTGSIGEADRLAANPSGSLHLALDGTFYNAAELSAALGKATASHAELLADLWARHGEDALTRLRGQFAAAVWDSRQRRLVLLRDRLGICPMHWTQQGDWLLFASEIKALLASGMVEAKPDLRGIAQVFTFFGLPGPVTCFQGVSALLPGHWLEAQPRTSGTGRPIERAWWKMDFPSHGRESDDASEDRLLDRYEALLSQAIERRLRADAPVVAYSSGGLDSSMIVALARRIRGEPLETFTFAIEHPTLRESSGAEILGGHLQRQPHLVHCKPSDVIGTFPGLVWAAESPVIDASAAALYRLAQAVHGHGHNAVLTGEGADEWQAGYPWFRIDKKLSYLDVLPGLAMNRRAFSSYVRIVHEPRFAWSTIRRAERAAAGHNAWLTVYNLMSVSKIRFFSRQMREALGDYLPHDDLRLDREGLKRWHPLNRSVYMGARVHLTGLHLNARGDRSAQHASVEPRYPFIDEDLVDFLAGLHPRWKMRGFQDKYLQRRLAERILPAELTQGRKRLLHAPLDAFHEAAPPPHIERLLTDDALLAAGYFDPVAVRRWRSEMHSLRKGFRRLFVEMGLAGVIATQLWHHAYIDNRIADVPSSTDVHHGVAMP
jgi:asparagine synthase (glutamine-hydrolysing)